MTSVVASPCVSQCSLDENQFCTGCLRHVSEVTQWSQASDAEKEAILRKIAERKTLQEREKREISREAREGREAREAKETSKSD
ncbi:MAG: DUF1289 domain-containing protein [Pseudomonadota bacterium]